MEFKDYYSIMSVEKGASADEIKRAYRKLARKYHPDVSKEADAESHFKEVGEAYEVLKDPQKRAAYDQLGANWKAGQEFRPPPNWDAGFEFAGDGFAAQDDRAASDFFEALFGNRNSRGPHRAGADFRGPQQDHHAKIVIDIEDAFRGATRAITLRAPALDAQGQVTVHERTLNVKIPKGVKPGQQIRLAGQGASALDGNGVGDLYLQVEFNAHPIYRVEGSDLYLTLPVAPWEAALGAKVKVPTPGGIIDLKVPANATAGTKLRLKGRGIPGKLPGDLYVLLQLVLPPGDSPQAQQLYRKMEQELAFNPRASLGV
ncbi:MAG: curved DNA-binding protein [Gammaproteobacteria bacterium]|jgi:curved DNA-binding protein